MNSVFNNLSVCGQEESSSIVNYSSRPSDTYMRQWIRPSRIQTVVYCLYGEKTLTEPVIAGLLLIGSLETNFS